jgi:hypothetical protein
VPTIDLPDLLLDGDLDIRRQLETRVDALPENRQRLFVKPLGEVSVGLSADQSAGYSS